MTRTAALIAVSAFCLLWTAGCASTDKPGSEAASPTGKPADATPDAHADVATLAKRLPGTLEGEMRRAQLLRTKGDYDEAARSLPQLLLIQPADGSVAAEYGRA